MLREQTKLMTGKSFQHASENPLDTITTLYSRIRLNQITRYEKNINQLESHTNIAHDKISSITDIVRRARELTIKVANGVWQNEDRLNVAVEIEQLLRESVALANSSFEDGYIFSGSKTEVKPFRLLEDFDAKLGKNVAGSVEYQGDWKNLNGNIDRNSEVEVLRNGAQIFWGSNQTIISRADSRNFISQENQKIRLDGYEVAIAAGDNLDIIIDKINSAVPSVTAFAQELSSGSRGMGIQTNFAHLPALEDIEGGTLLRSLGLLKEGSAGNLPYQNTNTNVLSNSNSLFDVLIRVRNAMVDNDTKQLSGRSLSDISQSLSNILQNQAKLSAVQSRMKTVKQDILTEKVHITQRRSKAEDADIAEASIHFNNFQYLHTIALRTAARLLPPSLLDYL